MKRINKNIRTLFWFALGLSVGLPAGILGIVFGAIHKIIPLLVLGILLVVGGFYVMPILWVKYGEKRQDRTLLNMIEHENIYTVSGLAAQTGYAEKTVREKLKKMLLTRELVGYLLVDDVLELNVNAKQTARTRRTQRCEFCGAMADFDGVKFVCEYCGGVSDSDSRS